MPPMIKPSDLVKAALLANDGEKHERVRKETVETQTDGQEAEPEKRKEPGTTGLKAQIADADVNQQSDDGDDWDVQLSQQELQAQILRELVQANDLAQQTNLSLLNQAHYDQTPDGRDDQKGSSLKSKVPTHAHPTKSTTHAGRHIGRGTVSPQRSPQRQAKSTVPRVPDERQPCERCIDHTQKQEATKHSASK